MGGKYKKPGGRAASLRLRDHPKWTREYNQIMQKGMNSSFGGQAREHQRAQLAAQALKWKGGTNFQVVGKKICHQLRKGLHWCNYYKSPNTYLRGTEPIDPRTGNTAYPYKSVISRCVLRHGAKRVQGFGISARRFSASNRLCSMSAFCSAVRTPAVAEEVVLAGACGGTYDEEAAAP